MQDTQKHIIEKKEKKRGLTLFFFDFMVGSTNIKVHYRHLLYWSVDQSLPFSLKTSKFS